MRPAGAYDHVVIGSGFTGVAAALHLARGGRSVALLDAERIGAGASRRNAGFIGRVMKKSFGDIADAKNEAYARKTYQELHAAYEGVFALAEAEGYCCHATRCGRFIGATAPGHRVYLDADLAQTERRRWGMISKPRLRTPAGGDCKRPLSRRCGDPR